MAHARQSRPDSGLGLQVKVRRPNMAHVRQSKSESGLGLQVKVLSTFCVGPIFARQRVSNTLVDRLLENGIPTTMARALEGWILEI